MDRYPKHRPKQLTPLWEYVFTLLLLFGGGALFIGILIVFGGPRP